MEAAADIQNTDSVSMAPYLPDAGSVTVLAADWCGHCKQLKKMLTDTGTPFREVLIEEDPVAEKIADDANGGDWIVPTVLFADGSTAVHPGLHGVTKRLDELSASTALEE